MNNEQKSEQQKAIRRFYIGSFFIALLCAVVVDLFLASMDGSSSDDVVWVFFYTFLSYLYLVRLQRLFFTSLRKKQVATIRGIWYWHF